MFQGSNLGFSFNSSTPSALYFEGSHPFVLLFLLIKFLFLIKKKKNLIYFDITHGSPFESDLLGSFPGCWSVIRQPVGPPQFGWGFANLSNH